MKNIFGYIIILCLCSSCREANISIEKESNNNYIRISTRNNRSSDFKATNFLKEITDSIILFSWSLEDDFVFEYQFPKTIGEVLNFENSCRNENSGLKEVKLNSKNYMIKRFSIIDCEDDGSTNIFYVDSIGIIINYSLNWGTYEMMIDSPNTSTQELQYLITTVLSDETFLTKHLD